MKNRIKHLAVATLSRIRTPLNLSWLLGWRDLFLAAGMGCVVRGVWMYSHALGWIASGLSLLALSFLMADPKLASKTVPVSGRPQLRNVS